mgnify:CR=1 FL=1
MAVTQQNMDAEEEEEGSHETQAEIANHLTLEMESKGPVFCGSISQRKGGYLWITVL